MNGIIHNCSHPDDEDISFRICEEEIFRGIFNYIDVGNCRNLCEGMSYEYFAT